MINFNYLRIHFRSHIINFSKYFHVKKIILLTGKSKTGKDFIGRKLTEKLSALLLHMYEFQQIEYKKFFNENLFNDKNIHRENMIKFVVL